MPLRDLFAFRRVLSELFGSGLHVRPPSHRCGRRNAKRFTDPVMGVTASPMIQPISERFRTRKDFRSLRGDDVALRPQLKATPEMACVAPGLRERRHRSLAHRLVALRRVAYLAVVAAGPHPATEASYGRRSVAEDAESVPSLHQPPTAWPI